MSKALYCHLCGEEFIIDENGIANHIHEDGEIDYDADSRHVPYSLENNEEDE